MKSIRLNVGLFFLFEENDALVSSRASVDSLAGGLVLYLDSSWLARGLMLLDVQYLL